MKKTYLITGSLILSVIAFSCKKDNVANDLKNYNHSGIIKISNTPSNSRVNLANAGLTLKFESPNADFNNPKGNNNGTASEYPYELVYNGKIESQQLNAQPLSALEIAAAGSDFAIGYQTPGNGFGGGLDIISLSNLGVPSLKSSASIPDADITCVDKGNSRLYLGMDLKTFEHYDFPAPAVMGIIDLRDGNLENPQTIGLEGYSVKDVKYNLNNKWIYAATSTNGGLVSVKLSHSGVASRVAYQPYGTARSIAISGTEMIATNGFDYSKVNPTTLAMSGQTWWQLPNNGEPLGRMQALSNGNYVFGNGMGFIYVNKNNGQVIDQVDLGGIVNAISLDRNFMYISTGNSLVVARIVNDKIQVIAKTHFSSTFGQDINVISSRVYGTTVMVACGYRGTYVFTLKEIHV